jgi:putative ABC transport system permease protein
MTHMFRFHAAPASIIGGSVRIHPPDDDHHLVRHPPPGETLRQPAPRIRHRGNHPRRKSHARWIAPAAALIGIAALAASKAIGPQGAFFMAGFSFLVAGLALFRVAGASRSSPSKERPAPPLTLSHLARLNIARRPTRSLVVVGSLAAGLFLVVSVTAFQKHGVGDWRDRASGSGGFAFWIETTTAVHRSSASDSTADILNLGDQRAKLGEILPFRIGTGDDASCFNLNSVTRPRLLATDTAALEQRGSFTIKSTAPGIDPSWKSLREGEPDVLRAFIDETTLMWVLKKSPATASTTPTNRETPSRWKSPAPSTVPFSKAASSSTNNVSSSATRPPVAISFSSPTPPAT